MKDKFLLLGALISSFILFGCGGKYDHNAASHQMTSQENIVDDPKLLTATYVDYYQNDLVAKHEFAQYVIDLYGLNADLYYAMLGQNTAFQQIGFSCIKQGKMTYTKLGEPAPGESYVPMDLNKNDDLKKCVIENAKQPLDFMVTLNNSILSTGLDFDNEKTKALIAAAEEDHILSVAEYLKISSSIMDSAET